MSALEPVSVDEVPDEIKETADQSLPEQLSKDVIFDLLQNPRRRQVLAYLREADETVTLSELAEQIAAWENDIEIRELRSAQRKCVYVGLYQTHLPKMDDAGVIDYNKNRGLITLSENADLLQEYLETVQERSDRWPQWYALASGGGMVWMASAYLGVPVLSSGSMSLVSGVVVGVLVLISFVHLISIHQNHQAVDNLSSDG